MKAGIVNIEFMISVFVFLVTISFLLINIVGNVIPLHREASLNSVRSAGYQLSHVLVFDEGDPKNWNENNMNRAGLSNGEKHMVSASKINSFGAACASSYNRLLDMYFGKKNLLLRVNITDSSGRSVMQCGNMTTPQFSIKRFAVLDTTNDIVEIEVSVRE